MKTLYSIIVFTVALSIGAAEFKYVVKGPDIYRVDGTNLIPVKSQAEMRAATTNLIATVNRLEQERAIIEGHLKRHADMSYDAYRQTNRLHAEIKALKEKQQK